MTDSYPKSVLMEDTQKMCTQKQCQDVKLAVSCPSIGIVLFHPEHQITENDLFLATLQ